MNPYHNAIFMSNLHGFVAAPGLTKMMSSQPYLSPYRVITPSWSHYHHMLSISSYRSLGHRLCSVRLWRAHRIRGFIAQNQDWHHQGCPARAQKVPFSQS